MDLGIYGSITQTKAAQFNTTQKKYFNAQEAWVKVHAREC